MIFSFSAESSGKINFEIDNTDIFCFFHSENAVSVPGELWLLAIASSLKMKKNVLILEEELALSPAINSTQRWQAGDHFLWVAPRGLSVLLEADHAISGSYQSMKTYLTTFK
jgi:hypothetical protein